MIQIFNLKYSGKKSFFIYLFNFERIICVDSCQTIPLIWLVGRFYLISLIQDSICCRLQTLYIQFVVELNTTMWGVLASIVTLQWGGTLVGGDKYPPKCNYKFGDDPWMFTKLNCLLESSTLRLWLSKRVVLAGSKIKMEVEHLNIWDCWQLCLL